MRVGLYLTSLDETPPVGSPVYTPSERSYCLGRRYPGPHLAGRYAAKKAASQALGLGRDETHLLGKIEVLRRRGGAPTLVFHGELASEVERVLRGEGVHVSISHSGNYAVALVVME